MPRDIEVDAVHLAYASYYKIDYCPELQPFGKCKQKIAHKDHEC